MSGLGSRGAGGEGGECGRFYERGFSPGGFFSLLFFRRTKENRVAVPFRRKQILSHTCVTFGDVNFSPGSFSFRSTYLIGSRARTKI